MMSGEAPVHFSSTLGGMIGTFTYAFLVILGSTLVGLVVALVMVRIRVADHPGALPVTVFLVLFAIGMIGLLVGTYAYAPHGFTVTHDSIVVERPISPVSIPYSQIESVRRAGDDVKGAKRVFGVGGLFGSYGRYYSKGLGSFRMYATDDRNAVVVRGNTTYVLTPDRPDEFVELVGKYLGPRS